ncbi:MAG TPA: beta-N-acetylhexosaminidase [Rhizomicrobium sp.]
MPMRAIYGCQGSELSDDERRFFAEAQPWGYILFGRNIAGPEQVRRLIDALRDCAGGEHAPVLIDQEGGRVARLGPPHWKSRPPAGRLGMLKRISVAAAREATYLNGRLIAHELCELGITVNCAPVLDVPAEGTDDIIGDRAFASDAFTIIDLGRATIEGMLDGGVLPIMKHIPGHGRAMADSHNMLPHVAASVEELSATDFVTFRSLNHCPMAMTAHVVYDAIDAQRPATTSPRVIRDVIRGEIGFEGVLISDDLSMGALSGTLGARAKAAQFAGCDIVLHCNGSLDEMREVAAEAKPLEDLAFKRAQAALGHRAPPQAFDVVAGEARFSELLDAAA